MITLDINSNFSDRGGGIRTYHRAKAAWFAGRSDRYYLIVPGPRAAVRRIGPRAVRIDVYGISVGGGYRILLDYFRVWRLLRRIEPQVVEAGDPLPSGLILLVLRAWGQVGGWLTAFYHSDYIETWLVPWAARGRRWRRWVSDLAAGLFYRAQRRYDATIVTSAAMQQHLAAQGVTRLVRKPLGVDPLFLASEGPVPVCRQPDGVPASAPGRAVVRMLFVGRLGTDKGADLLLAILPQLLALDHVAVTVVGSGMLSPRFDQLQHPRLQRLAFVATPAELVSVYRRHDVLLAPGHFETFGLAVLEAMACGLVVVGPDRGGAAEMLAEARSPYVFRAADAADFLQAATRAANEPHEAAAASARAAALRYGTWQQAIGRLAEYYAEVCSQPGSVAGGKTNRSAARVAQQARRPAA